MNRLALATCVLLGVGCAHRPPATDVETGTPASDPGVSEPEALPERVAGTPRTPRTLRANGHDAEVTLTEDAGFLVDGNAPPPPPGVAITRHPAVGGGCIGAPRGCSLAGTAVRSGATFDAVARALEIAGFTVAIQ